MKLFKTLVVAAILGVAFIVTPSPAKADHNPYWRNHWGWYDNTYRPYYQRYYGPSYGGAYYGNSYYARPYYGGAYYGGGYYGNPGVYYNSPGVGVQVGPLTFGWW